MEIEFTQEKLARALNIVSKVAVGGRSTLPILNNVLIKAEGKKVSFITTNLDMAIVDFVPVTKATDGAITVPAKLFSEFVNNLPRGEKVTLRTSGTKAEILSGSYSSKINGADAADFPELPELDEKKTVKYKIGVDEFRTGVSEVIVATGTDTTRPALTGVYFNTYDGRLYIAGTDGYRIAEREFISKVDSEVKAIVPTTTMQEVLRCISDDVSEVEIVFEENQARFRLGEIEVTSKLIDATFPDYRLAIPKDMEINLVLDRDELVRITKMAAVFAQGSSGAISCEVDAKAGKFYVSSISNEMGENKSEINVKSAASGAIKLDSRFLMSALNSLEEAKVMVDFSNKPAVDGRPQPILLRNEKSNKYLHLIMPLDF